MFKTEIKEIEKRKIIAMWDMKPLQIGRIVETGFEHNGEFVMRTASTDKFEIMSLSKPKENGCWTYSCEFEVELLPPGTQIILEITED